MVTMPERASAAAAAAPPPPAPHHHPAQQQQQKQKSVENTVFVRFQPGGSDAPLRRHHVEDVFSEVGPIKKCSVIHNRSANSSYGFVKFTAPEDAELAAVQLNGRQIQVDDDQRRGTTKVTVHCELAKKQQHQQQHQAGVGTAAEPPGGAGGGRNNNNNNNNSNVPKHHHPKHALENEDHPHHREQQQPKKTNRLILRNLSFYAKEKDVRQALEPMFGELLEVHIPRVVSTSAAASSSSRKGGGGGGAAMATHRGFAFVTFAAPKAAKKCLQRYGSSSKNSNPQQQQQQQQQLVIKDRPVQIARSLHKTAHQAQQAKQRQQQQQRTKPFEKQEEMDDEMEDKEESSSVDDDDSKDDDESSSSSESEDDSNDEEDSDYEEDPTTTQQQSRQQRPEKDETAVQEKRCLFLRNLPFDCTRHDIFESFRRFGFITAIYLVKDLETHKIPRGTAFVSFQKPQQAAAALEAAATAAASSGFVSQRHHATVEEQWEHHAHRPASTIDSGIPAGIVVKGRRLLVDLAVDKSTAQTLTASEKKHGEGESGSGKDRRNLYLKGEGRVENDEKAGILAWDELPETDKLKRQTAWSEKNTKLRSPLFFINPNRLSFRNLAKHVDESDLKQLCVDAIQRGLERNLVTAEDQIALWRASGEMTTRGILARIQEADDSETSILPSFDPKNVKQFIPSVHVHRDYAPGANKHAAPSRGFGFVEFEHHAHALACLREVNNNARYSAEFATGGKQAAEMKRRRAGKKPRAPTDAEDALASDVLVDPSGRVRTPRLIVEFTVENKAKAKQQAAHRAQQQANQIKQLQEQKHGSNLQQQQQQKKSKKEKKSRGAKQRERKRKQLEEGGDTEAPSTKPEKPTITEQPMEKPKKPKGKKPPKKQKVDQAEENFSKLVETYKREAVATVSSSGEKAATTKKNPGKRWFES